MGDRLGIRGARAQSQPIKEIKAHSGLIKRRPALPAGRGKLRNEATQEDAGLTSVERVEGAPTMVPVMFPASASLPPQNRPRMI